MANYAQNAKGAYLGKLMGAHFGGVGEKDTPFIFLDWSITHFAQDGDWVAANPSAVAVVRLCLNEKSMPYTSKKLARMGFNDNWDNPGFDPKWYEGDIGLTCEHKEFNGNTNEEWSIDDLKGGGEFKPLDNAVMAAIKAAYKSTVPPKGAPPAPPRAPAPKTAPPSAPTATQTATKDDLPF